MNKKDKIKAEFWKQYGKLEKSGRPVSEVMTDTISIIVDVLVDNLVWSEGSGPVGEGWSKIFGLETLVTRACASYMCDKEATWRFQKGM